MSKQKKEKKKSENLGIQNKLSAYEEYYKEIKLSFLNLQNKKMMNCGFESLDAWANKLAITCFSVRQDLAIFEKKNNFSNKNKYNNEFALINIKLNSLFLKICMRNNDQNLIIMQIKKQSTLKDLVISIVRYANRIEFKHDLDFQEELKYCAFILLQEFKTIPEPIPSLGKLYDMLLQLFNKMNPCYEKLDFYKLYFTNICNLFPQVHNERFLKDFAVNFLNTYEILIENYTKSPAPDLRELLLYIKTMLLGFDFNHIQGKNHHFKSTTGKVNILQKSEYFQFKLKIMQHYISPVTALCSNIDLVELTSQPKLMHDYDFVVLRLIVLHMRNYQELKEHYYLLKLTHQNVAHRQFLINEIPLAHAQLLDFLSNHTKYMQHCNSPNNLTIDFKGYEEMLDDLDRDKQELEQLKADSALQLLLEEKKANDAALVLIQEEDAKYQAPLPIKKSMEIVFDESSTETSEEKCISLDPELTTLQEIHEHLKLGQTLFINKNTLDAIQEFNLAKVKAEKANNNYLLLCALDGCLLMYANLITFYLETVDTLYQKRLSTKYPFPASLKDLILKVNQKFEELDRELNHYHNLLMKETQNLPKEEHRQFSINHEIICAQVKDIYLHADKIKEHHEKLKSIKKKAKERYKLSKANGEINPNPSKHYFKEENIMMATLNPYFNDLLDHSNQLHLKYANKMRVEIPDEERKRFTKVTQVSNNPCLVGGRALNIVLEKLGKPKISTEDYDFLTLYIPPKTFICSEYTRTHNLQVYVYPPLAIQVFSLKQDIHTISTSFLQRDFTAFSIGIFQNGDVIGLTDQCREDIENRILRTNENPIVSIQKDPIRILRAIKMELKAWNIDPLLQKAIISWKPDSTYPDRKTHLFITAKKILENQDKAGFINILIRYGLMDTMFGFDIQSSNIETLIIDFEKHLNASLLAGNSQRFFSKNSMEKITEKKLIQDIKLN